MPGYTKKVLHRYQHVPPARPQNTSHPAPTPQFGKPAQAMAPLDDSPPLDEQCKKKKRVQGVVRLLLYYVRTVDNTLPCALKTVTRKQSAPTGLTNK